MTSNSASAARGAELRRIAHYREQAAQYRQWAADEAGTEVRDGLLDMARQYDQLAGQLEAKSAFSATQASASAEYGNPTERLSGANEAQRALAIDMEMVAEYRRRAAEVEQLAEEAVSEDHRQRILGIARSWRELADQREWLLAKRYGAPPSSK